jgi:hypothetical protein
MTRSLVLPASRSMSVFVTVNENEGPILIVYVTLNDSHTESGVQTYVFGAADCTHINQMSLNVSTVSSSQIPLIHHSHAV